MRKVLILTPLIVLAFFGIGAASGVFQWYYTGTPSNGQVMTYNATQGAWTNAASSGGGGSPGGTGGQTQYNNAGAFGGYTMGGDGTINTTSGILTVTKSGGVSFGSNAFTSTAYAPLASPALTGAPTAPTAAPGTNTTQIATTAFVLANGGGGGLVTVPNGGTGTTNFTSGALLLGNGTGPVQSLGIGSGLTVTGGALTSTSSGGTVTSVGLTMPTQFSVGNSPVTGSGTFAVTLSGTAFPVANGGTNATTAKAAVVNLTPASFNIPGTVIDWSQSPVQYLTLPGNVTFTFSNSVDGESITVILSNVATNYTVIWPTLLWPNGATPTMTTGTHTDVYLFINRGGTIYGTAIQNY